MTTILIYFLHSDILIVIDETESQVPYIDTIQAKILGMCQEVICSPNVDPLAARFGLIAFRDYQLDDPRVANAVRAYRFTNDVEALCHTLSTLRAFGGEDGPEALTPALYNALTAPWNEDAKKVVIFVTGSSPHVIEDARDDYPHRSPDGTPVYSISFRNMLIEGVGHNPWDMARHMAEKGIILVLMIRFFWIVVHN